MDRQAGTQVSLLSISPKRGYKFFIFEIHSIEMIRTVGHKFVSICEYLG